MRLVLRSHVIERAGIIARYDDGIAANLLKDVHNIADTCEKLRQGFAEIASANANNPELRQAAADLAGAIEHVFRVARYIAEKIGAN